MCGLSMDRSVSLHCIAHVWEHYLYCFPYKAISLHGTSRQWWVISELCHGNVYTMWIYWVSVYVNNSDTMETLKPKCVNLPI